MTFQEILKYIFQGTSIELGTILVEKLAKFENMNINYEDFQKYLEPHIEAMLLKTRAEQEFACRVYGGDVSTEIAQIDYSIKRLKGMNELDFEDCLWYSKVAN